MIHFPKIKLISAILLASLLLPGPGNAIEVGAPPIRIARTWQTDEGLPDNSVTGLVQGEDGYLWVATMGGLMRFDGVKFEEFSLLHIPGVPNRVVHKLFKDRNGHLWLIMDRGTVVCIRSDSARVYNQKDGLDEVQLTSIAEDAAGAIWLAGGSTVYRIFEDKVSQFGATEGLPVGGYSWLSTDATGRLWFVRGTKVGLFREGEWQRLLQFVRLPVRLYPAKDGSMWICDGTSVLKFSEGSNPEERAHLPGKFLVTMLFEDHTGVLWIGTAADGLYRLIGNMVEKVETSHNEILCATEDREGNMWVGTGGGGLNLLRPRAIDLFGTKDGMPSESIRSVCQDADGWFWVAMSNGSIARGRSNHWSAVTAADGWPGGNVFCIAPGREGGVWIGTRDHGLQFLRDGKFQQWDKSNGLTNEFIRSLLVATNGDVLIGTVMPHGVVRFHNGQFQTLETPEGSRSPRALAEGADGTIWVGTSAGRTLRVSGSTVVTESAVGEARSMSIRSLHLSADGSLWIGYAGWGVGRLWNGHYARITMAQGLHDDYISQIQSDDLGGMWFIGNHGLFRVRQKELMAVTEGRAAKVRSIVYGHSEGLPALQAVFDDSPNLCRSPDGQLWFATRNGLLHVRPEYLPDNPISPLVALERVLIDGQTVALWNRRSPLRTGPDTNTVNLSAARTTLLIPPGHRQVEFQFTAMSFTSPENVNFRYLLKNYDSQWIEAGSQRSAMYPQLPPGRYEFHVQACNNTGLWNEAGIQLDLEVPRFYWQSWWFRSAFLVVFVGSIVGLARYFLLRRLRRKLERLEQQESLQRERTRIARDMHDEVGSKLSRLSLLSEMASQDAGMSQASRSDVAEISETARDTIRSFEEIVWAVNPRNDSLTQLMNYICRFAEEFFEGSVTHCVFDVPDEIPAIELPTGARHQLFLAAKEALNNVLKHAQARQVCVRLKLIGTGFKIGIEDDGLGFGGEAKSSRGISGNGLENMRHRLKQVGGEFEIQSHPGAGTRVTFYVRSPHHLAV